VNTGHHMDRMAFDGARIQIVRTDADQPWHVRIRAGNHEATLGSENYADEASAVAAVELLGRTFSPANRADYVDGRLHVWLHESDPKGGLFIQVQVVDERVAS
jgi:uncharacterized protein YegP (UPF0339 family)